MEWKLHRPGHFCKLFGALETSLVEWKLDIASDNKDDTGNLGNFLSGMETGDDRMMLRDLGTLETSLVEWKRRARIFR